MKKAIALTIVPLTFLGAQSVFAQEYLFPDMSCFTVADGFIASADPVWFNSKGSSDSDNHQVTVAALQKLDAYLAEMGKDLLLVYPPRPSMFLPEELAISENVDKLTLEQDFEKQLGYLMSSGLSVWDTHQFVDRFDGTVTLHRLIDHHWSTSGAIAAAYDISLMLGDDHIEPSAQDFIEIFSSFDTVLRGPYHPAAWTAANNGTCDLTGYGYLDYDVRFPDAQSPAASLEDALFGESTERSVVFGTSFSTMDGQVFVRALQHFMATDVVGMAITGGGASTSIALGVREVVEDPTYRHVIWEVENVFGHSAILGAATLAQGILDGTCTPDTPLYREFLVNADVSEWFDIPGFTGSFDILQIDAPWDLNIQFELTYIDSADEEIAEIGSASLRGVGAENAPADTWLFRVPDVADTDGKLMQLAHARVRVLPYEHGNAEASGPISYTVTGCMKPEADRVQLSAL